MGRPEGEEDLVGEILGDDMAGHPDFFDMDDAGADKDENAGPTENDMDVDDWT